MGMSDFFYSRMVSYGDQVNTALIVSLSEVESETGNGGEKCKWLPVEGHSFIDGVLTNSEKGI